MDSPPTQPFTDYGHKLYIVLQHAQLEVAMTKKGVELLNNLNHSNFISKKLGLDPADFRPDLVHQSLLALFDTPLNKAGRLIVFLHTKKGVLIRISPHIRLPRTYKRFSGLMA